MDTLSIQDIAESNADKSQDSSEFKQLSNGNNSPRIILNHQINNSLEGSRLQSRCDDQNQNVITTADILNHDYNQLKIEEGRIQRMNFKKERSNSKNNDENDLFITHVTLNLDVLDNRSTSGSPWKYNSIRKNNSFLNSAKTSSTLSRLNTGRTNDSKKDPFLSLTSASNRYSVNNSECSEIQIQESNNTGFGITNNRSKMSKPREATSTQSSAINLHSRTTANTPQQRVNFQVKGLSKKNRPSSEFGKTVSYMDIIRSKSSATNQSTSSIFSNDKRNNPKHSYSVAEYNKFKNQLLKNHSRNYYMYDSVNLNNEFLKSQVEPTICSLQTTNLTPILNSYNIGNNNNCKPRAEKQMSQIKSIYETIQRANNSKIFSLEMRRSNYINNIKNTETILSSSLIVNKIK